MEKVNVGVIGCGYWGPNLIRNLAQAPGSNLVVVSDLKEDRLANIRNTYPTVATTRDYHDLFSMGLDAVIIATPPATHYSIARDCLDHGLHVLVEKPLTLNSRHAEDLIQTADAADRVLMVGHTFEYNSAVNRLKQIISSGEIGDVYYVDTVRLNLGLFQPNSNALWDLAPHDISILLYILGQLPVSVSAQGSSCVFPGIQDVVYMNLVFPNNILAHVHVSWLDPCKVRRTTVVGSKKMVVYNDLLPTESIKIYDKGVETPVYPITYADFQCNYRYGDVVIPNVRMAEPLRQEVMHFLDCIVNHKQPQSSGRVGLNVIKILEATQCSMMDGQGPEVLQW